MRLRLSHCLARFPRPYAAPEKRGESPMRLPGSEQKDRLHQTFLAALNLLDKQCREPDRWEEECLSYALGALACGLYPAAEVELAAFARPPSERLPEEVAMLENKPRRFTKD